MHLQTTENSRQHLLLRTGILQKTVLGCPWLLKSVANAQRNWAELSLAKTVAKTSGIRQSVMGLFFSFSLEVWLVSYLSFSFQIWYMRKWMFTSIGQSKHMRVTSFNISRVSAWTEALPSVEVAALHLCICTWLVQSDPEHMHLLDPEHWH